MKIKQIQWRSHASAQFGFIGNERVCQIGILNEYMIVELTVCRRVQYFQLNEDVEEAKKVAQEAFEKTVREEMQLLEKFVEQFPETQILVKSKN